MISIKKSCPAMIIKDDSGSASRKTLLPLSRNAAKMCSIVLISIYSRQENFRLYDTVSTKRRSEGCNIIISNGKMGSMIY